MRSPFTHPETKKVYTFDHLKPFDLMVSVTIAGVRYIVPIVIIFSPHCYTDGKNNTVKMDDPLYLLTDSTGHRIFCEIRYNRSLSLATRFREVVEKNSNCFKLRSEGNYLHIHDPQPKNKYAGWYILFKFDNPKAGVPEAVKVSITSYHYRQDKPENLRWTSPLKFPALLANWLNSRPNNLKRCTITPVIEDTDQEKGKPA